MSERILGALRKNALYKSTYTLLRLIYTLLIDKSDCTLFRQFTQPGHSLHHLFPPRTFTYNSLICCVHLAVSAAAVANCCNEHVCVYFCLSVCLSVREHISRTTRAIFTKFFVHVAYRRGSVLLQGKGVILGVFFPTENELYGQYSDMNFDTKDRFGLNLLLCRKVGHNSIAYY